PSIHVNALSNRAQHWQSIKPWNIRWTKDNSGSNRKTSARADARNDGSRRSLWSCFSCPRKGWTAWQSWSVTVRCPLVGASATGPTARGQKICAARRDSALGRRVTDPGGLDDGRGGLVRDPLRGGLILGSRGERSVHVGIGRGSEVAPDLCAA